MMKRLSILSLLVLSGLSIWAQNSTQGTEFWFSFMENGYKVNAWNDWVETQVMVSAKRACSGTIVNPSTLWQTTFSVGNEGTVMIDIPESAGYHDLGSDEIHNLGLKLMVDDTVSVYITNFATNSFDASFVLPVESLGSEYVVQCDNQSRSHPNVPNKETSAFLVVAIDDNTIVEVTPSVATAGGHPAGHTFTVTLNAGQTLPVKSNYIIFDRDLSGTRVVAKDGKKIALFNGNTLTCIPGDLGKGHDHIFEQAIPIDTWGRQFAVTGSEGRYRDLVKITAAADNDTIWCNSTYMTTLNAGQSHTFWLYASGGYSPVGSCFIETSQPSHVYLYNTTSYDDPAQTRRGDPSVVWIPPIEQRISEISFCTFHHELAPIDVHYVNIVVDRSSIGVVYLDGLLIDSTAFQPVNGNNSYYFVRQQISHGNHHLACPMGMVAHIYGFGTDKGYAYCAGSNLLDLKSVLYVNGLLGTSYYDGLSICAGSEAVFEVKTNFELQQVQWDFGDGQSAEGTSISHLFLQAGDFAIKALVEGINAFSQEHFNDTLTFPVHVKEFENHNDTIALCDVSTFEYFGTEYTESGYYEMEGENENSCYKYQLTLDFEFTPDFEIEGSHFPVGGSETHISENEYVIQLVEPRAHIDTVLWQVDCPNWRVEPHGSKGKYCTLYIHSYLLEPVTLHAMAINRCDTVQRDFSIQTSYFDLPEANEVIEFEVAPNPCDGRLTLRFGNMVGSAEIEVYNSIGQKTDAIRLDLNTCKEVCYTMTNYDNGLYYFVLKHNGRTRTKKVALIR